MTTVDRVQDAFARFAGRTAVATGSFWAFTAAGATILIWAAMGPIFGFSQGWQLAVNTGTTIVTVLMVFVIQHAANKDTRAVQLKLNELLASVEGASNRLIDVEDLSDRELQHLYARYRHLAANAARLAPGAKTTIEAEEE